MATNYSNVMNILIMIFILLATIFCFFAASYIILPQTASASTVSNHDTARSLLYGAGAIGIFITVIYLFYIIFTLWSPAVDITNPLMVSEAMAGYGTWILVILMIVLFIFMAFLIIYAISLLDTTIANIESARSWSIFAVVLVMIALVLEFINIFLIYSYNNYLKSLGEVIVAPVNVLAGQPIKVVPMVVQPISLGNVFNLTRNPAAPGKFVGSVSLDGVLKNEDEYIQYGDLKIKNEYQTQPIPVRVKYTINEGETVVNAPLQQRQVEVVQPVRQVEVVQPVRQVEVVQPVRQPQRQIQRQMI